jgi:tripartite ATP-independent transporter DctM subunit
MIAVFIGLLIALMIIGVPVAFALGFTNLVALIIDRGVTNIPFEVIAQRLIYALDNFPVLAVPFFLLAGKLMNVGGITDRIFNFVNCAVGYVRGGLGHVNVVASMIFAGMSGSATADAAGLGAIEIRAMEQAGYDRDFSIGITASSAMIGTIIPPSIPMVLYAVLAEVSVAELFLGGLVPGVLMGISLMVLVVYFSIRRNYAKGAIPSWKELFTTFFRASLALLTPIIIIGGIWGGIFTPTEAGAVSVFYAIFLACIFYRDLSFKGLVETMVDSMRDVAKILFILSCGSFYGWLLIRFRIPYVLTDSIISFTTHPLAVLVIINIFFLLVGCFLSTVVSITIFTPLIMPLIKQVGIDPIYFGVIMAFNLTLGNITPPFGMVLYVLAGVTRTPFPRVVRAVFPFLLALITVLILVILVPQLSTYIPYQLMRR